MHEDVTVQEGARAGRTLGELQNEDAAALLGPAGTAASARGGRFPLLIKRLAVGAWLSLQVHPDDEQATRLENAPHGKEEAWFVLGPAAGEAEFILGLREGVSQEELKAAVNEPERWPGLLRRVRAGAGAALHIPPGTVHAIGPGATLYEVQQNSDITYRFYDWGRLGLDGRPRTLHAEKALQVTRLENRPSPRVPEGDDALLFETAHFRTTRLRILKDGQEDGHEDGREEGHGEGRFDTAGRSPHALTVIAGALTIESAAAAVSLAAGRTALLPAALGPYRLCGAGVVLRSELGAP